MIRLGADAVSPLLDALQTQDLNLLAIYQQILAQIPAASPQLTQAIRSAHPLVRGRVVEVFAINKDKTAIPTLLEALRGEFFTVRARAALALANMGDASVLPDLLPLLRDREIEARIAACAAVGRFHDPATFEDLANVLLDDPIIEVRQAALKALGDSCHPAAVPFLMEALRDSFWWFEREQAVQDLLAAIEKIGDPVVVPLIEALSDREKTVRKFAAMILGNLRDIRAIDELGMTLYDLHHEVGQAAAEALAQFGAPAVAVLAEALSHPEAAVRGHAIRGLGRIRDERVTPYLIEMLQDPDQGVRRQAIESLAKLRDPRSILALQEAAANRADRGMAELAKETLRKFHNKLD
ncbi:MAG: HEAT repeat domain-containing protein [Chloroflexi bacterium]|nr:HEAT repeat domain-containing protein [Chloroflexota bacterium]